MYIDKEYRETNKVNRYTYNADTATGAQATSGKHFYMKQNIGYRAQVSADKHHQSI